MKEWLFLRCESGLTVKVVILEGLELCGVDLTRFLGHVMHNCRLQIFREMDFGDCKSAECGILTHFEG